MAPKVEILATDPLASLDQECFIRILYVEEKDDKQLESIRYAKVQPNVFPSTWLEDPYTDFELPVFPPGDWRVVDIIRNEVTGEAQVIKPREDDRMLIGRSSSNALDAWHPISVDYLELEKVSQILYTNLLWRRSDTLWLVTHEELFPMPVLMKIAEFPVSDALTRVENETKVYQAIQGKGIAPEFLGHVTENGRVIGSLFEYIDGECPEKQDLPRCERVLRKFHREGFLHGDSHPMNFVVCGGGTTKLIDFETSRPCTNQVEFDKEVRNLRLEFEL